MAPSAIADGFHIPTIAFGPGVVAICLQNPSIKLLSISSSKSLNDDSSSTGRGIISSKSPPSVSDLNNLSTTLLALSSIEVPSSEYLMVCSLCPK